MNPEDDALDIIAKIVAEMILRSSKYIEVEREGIKVKGYWVGDVLRIDITGLPKV